MDVVVKRIVALDVGRSAVHRNESAVKVTARHNSKEK
jgi:hypothetical protein